MRPIEIALVNASSSLTDQDVATGLRALQQQVREDFAPVWHVDAELHLVPHERARIPYAELHRPDCELQGRWGLVLLDGGRDGDPVRGYHDLTYHGRPLATVFVDRLAPGRDWTHVASHELMEMLADPDCTSVAYRHPDAVTVLFYAREICDPCAAYTDGYEKCGRWVSDFIFPSWFETNAPRREVDRFDERGLVTEPFEVLPGGYIGVYDPTIAAWTLQGSDPSNDEVRQPGSRMERRSTADNRWLDSDMSTSP